MEKKEVGGGGLPGSGMASGREGARLPAGLSAAGGGVTSLNYPHAAIPEAYGGEKTNWYREVALRLAENSQGELRMLDEDGAEVPAIEEEDDVADDDEGVREMIAKIYKVVFGSLTVLLMHIALALVVVVRSLLHSHQLDAAANGWTVAGVLYGTALGVSSGVLLIRFVWTTLIVKPFFPDRRTLNLLTWFLDPEFGTLLWTLALLLLFNSIVEPHAKDQYHLPRVGRLSAGDYRTYRYTLIFLVLWASGDFLVKTIMLNLMLGFLMSFNTEVVNFLHRYSQIRRLNAAWVRLIPASDLSIATADSAAGLPRGEGLVTLESLRQTANPVERARRQREYSKQRLRALAQLQRSASKQQVSRRGSKLTDLSLAGDEGSLHTALDVEAAEDPLPETSKGELLVERDSKWNFEFTTRQKKRREREYNIEYTGRALPRLLDAKSILDTQKSQLSNLIAINWVREQPVVIFVDGQRCELRSKAMARRYGQALYYTLLEFRQTLIDVVEEERHILQETRDGQLASTRAMANVARRMSGSVSSAPRSTQVAPAASSSSGAASDAESLPLVERTLTQPKIYDRIRVIGATDVREVDVRTSADRAFEDTAQHGAEPTARLSPWGRRREDVPKSPGRSWYQKLPLSEAQLAQITADEIRKVKLQMPDDRECLTEDFFQLFMSAHDAKQLCNFLDPGKLGKITARMFTTGIVETYKIRKQIVHSLEAQEEIESVFTRVCEYLVTYLCILIFLLILGIDPNTIIVTGVSVLTAAGLVLSFVYTDFVQSIILLVFLNPYRIGDRVRIDGEAQYVKRITTYFTEFESLEGKPQYMSHKELVAKVIINESRCKNATSEIRIFFSERTTPSQYAAFKKVLEAYLKSRPQEFLGDSLFVYIAGVAPSHYIELSIWVTHTDGWGNWMVIRTSESSLMHFIMRQAQILGMYYKLPVQRWEQFAPPARAGVGRSLEGAARTPEERERLEQTAEVLGRSGGVL